MMPRSPQEIESCAALFFTGGQQDRIVNAFKPGGRETAISKAIDRVLERGGIVAGTSAGAAIMSDPMIMGGESDGRPRREDDAVAADGQGKLGYFPYGIVDPAFPPARAIRPADRRARTDEAGLRLRHQ